MKKLFRVGVVAVLVFGVWAYFRHAKTPAQPVITQATALMGDVVESVTASGTLSPTRTVEIGSQVSGQVSHVYVDFNSLVTKGEVLARMDTGVFQQHLESAKAIRDEAEIALDEHKISLTEDQHNLARTEELFERGLVSQTDREAIELQVKMDQAQVVEDRSTITLGDAQVEQAQVDLDHCTITSPIDGVVIERDVDDGQAVAAGVQAPKLFVLATSLRTLELLADIDEAYVTKLKPGQEATFTVEDYPRVNFRGVLANVRLASTETNSIVTYKAVIDVTNADLRLRPAMTAQISMNVSRASNVLRVPNAALKFRPTHEIFDAFGQPPPEAVRVADAAGQVYVIENGRLKRITLTLGVTDGTWTAVESGDLKPEQAVVTAITLPGAKPAGPASSNPLAPTRRG